MKQIGSFRKFTYSSAEYLYGGCSIAIATLQFIKEIDTSNPGKFLLAHSRLNGLIQILQDWVLLLTLLAIVVGGICFIIRRQADPRVLEKIKFILDQYRVNCFAKVESDPDDHHRVTLFRCENSFLLLVRDKMVLPFRESASFFAFIVAIKIEMADSVIKVWPYISANIRFILCHIKKPVIINTHGFWIL